MIFAWWIFWDYVHDGSLQKCQEYCRGVIWFNKTVSWLKFHRGFIGGASNFILASIGRSRPKNFSFWILDHYSVAATSSATSSDFFTGKGCLLFPFL